MVTLFRNAVIDVMPPAVKSRLEDVVGFNSKTHKEFCDNVSPAVGQYRKKMNKSSRIKKMSYREN